MTAMSYRRVIPCGDDNLVYVISNGIFRSELELEPDNKTNQEYPSLIVEVERHSWYDMNKFFENLGEPEFIGQECDFSEIDSAEIQQALNGQYSSWKLTSIRFNGYDFCFNFRNYSRAVRNRNRRLHTASDVVENGQANDESQGQIDYVWYRLRNQTEAQRFTVKAFNKKGKMKHKYEICCRYDEEKRCTVAYVEEYSKKRLERVIRFYSPTEGTHEVIAEITEFKH